MKVCLSIAGSDSGGGAGIQADLKTFSALGIFGTTALTAITAQNTVEVSRVEELSAEMVAAQIDAVATDIGVDAAKTGMLASAPIVEAVVDPVMVAKSGARLLKDDALTVLKSRLLPLAEVVTPNLPEAGALADLDVTGEDAMREAARRIHRLGARRVVIKGGHLDGPSAVDLYYDGSSFEQLRGERIATRNTHGTGCTFAAAITAYLAHGLSPLDAVTRAKEFLTAAIRSAPGHGRGAGPLNHLHTQNTE